MKVVTMRKNFFGAKQRKEAELDYEMPGQFSK
jgi:hypothetical protein